MMESGICRNVAKYEIIRACVVSTSHPIIGTNSMTNDQERKASRSLKGDEQQVQHVPRLTGVQASPQEGDYLPHSDSGKEGEVGEFHPRDNGKEGDGELHIRLHGISYDYSSVMPNSPLLSASFKSRELIGSELSGHCKSSKHDFASSRCSCSTEMMKSGNQPYELARIGQPNSKGSGVIRPVGTVIAVLIIERLRSFKANKLQSFAIHFSGDNLNFTTLHVRT
ncbi:hypothetical protein DFH29DRAFT_1066858 [Suillus ampliporus]|nr:hypothetical protein DFH29DRAFT_1066858 [Suillus ampliporus]